MSAAHFLCTLVKHLDAAGIHHMVAGSFASTYHGRPRSTQDIDIVVELEEASLLALLQALPQERFYVSEEAAREALKVRQQFNIIDTHTGWKAVLIIRKARPFSRVEFNRRTRATILGSDTWVASAEDTLLAKLEWASRSGSDRQVEDAAGILEIAGDNLDVAYIERWADELGVTALWNSLVEPSSDAQDP